MNDIMEQSLRLARPDLLREACLIDGLWITTEDGIAVQNPATLALVGCVPDGGRAEALTAVAAAAAAFRPWKAMTAKARGVILRRWYDLVLAHKTDLARLMTAEQGKPLHEAEGEILYAASFIDWFAEEGKRAYGDVIPGHLPDMRLTVTKEPVGIVAAVTPWNFPAAMVTRKVAPALAAGCAIVLKPSELTPFSALALGVLAQEAGIPDGVFNIITGQPQAIGDVLTGDPRIAKFTFTGSTPVGKKLAANCMSTVKRVSLELGGNAPFIVFNDADPEAAIAGIVASKFRNTGQTCVCANRVLVQSGIYDLIAEGLAARVQGFTTGDGLTGKTDQGPLIDARAIAKFHDHLNDAVRGGAKIIAQATTPDLQGHFAPATVLIDVRRDARLNQEETFGPLAGLVRFDTEDELIGLMNDTRAGLAGYIFTRDISRANRVSEALECGMVGLNTGLISTEVAPFGGVKESGFGREGSHYGLDDYLNLKL
ncbi:MAG TPA: NAD-dependent succinate-semialdehyde dehydrogenase, partial [Asticcacaulis sp.]|nr:NAD-dependent succinate-semialdehyde dehydrogenase [Asticcacaulis sp.]